VYFKLGILDVEGTCVRLDSYLLLTALAGNSGGAEEEE
jgi:hypothetical protein